MMMYAVTWCLFVTSLRFVEMYEWINLVFVTEATLCLSYSVLQRNLGILKNINGSLWNLIPKSELTNFFAFGNSMFTIRSVVNLVWSLQLCRECTSINNVFRECASIRNVCTLILGNTYILWLSSNLCLLKWTWVCYFSSLFFLLLFS